MARIKTIPAGIYPTFYISHFSSLIFHLSFFHQTSPYGYNNSYAYDPFECSKRFASRTADVTRNKCVIYVPTHAVGNYRNSDNLWADFIFAMPVTPSNDRTSFTSDVPFTIYQFNGTNWVKGGYKAYYVKPNGVKGNSVTMTTLGANIAPAGFGVVLFATAGETNYVFMKPVSETSTYLSCGNNLMKGVVEPKIQMSDLVEAYPENTYYVVKNGNFNQVNSGNLSFGKAYLEIPKAKSKANMIMQYDDDETTTSIRLVNFGEDADSQMYDLQGRRVDNPAKGVYLQNGTKRVVR